MNVKTNEQARASVVSSLLAAEERELEAVVPNGYVKRDEKSLSKVKVTQMENRTNRRFFRAYYSEDWNQKRE